MRISFCDETEFGFGWTVHEFVQRTSHALVAGGRVWLVDAVAADGVEERVRALGEPAGMLQLLDRHERDCAELARSFGVPHVRAYEDAPALPFELVPIAHSKRWREVALWWPERRVLVAADALGTVGYFLAPGDRLGVHPLLRLRPPRRLRGLEPAHVLVGHGHGVHEAAAEALREALSTARRRAPGILLGLLRARRARGRRDRR